MKDSRWVRLASKLDGDLVDEFEVMVEVNRCVGMSVAEAERTAYGSLQRRQAARVQKRRDGGWVLDAV